jgi:hypothetical protein
MGDEVALLAEKGDYVKAIDLLLQQQLNEWQLLSNGRKSLDSVKEKEFEFDGYTIKVQYNPGRITSSSAKVDPLSIKERKCFLCPSNLPKEQRGIEYNSDYLILVNPFPIFPSHLTIIHKEHLPQQIDGYLRQMLTLSKDLADKYVVFYNGPQCGASAPDHFHFQAGDKGFMPIDYDYDKLKQNYWELMGGDEEINIWYVDDGLRKFIAFESENPDPIIEEAEDVIKALKNISNAPAEPLMNIICSYVDDKWRLIIIPRHKHRPTQYFAEGDENILLSPASVDIGGVCITPLEKDFNKITENDLTDIFKQVMMSDEDFEALLHHREEE